jgi:serine/threonine protein kinase
LVLEFLEGTDLARFIEKCGALPLPVAIDYMLRACEALASVHDAEVVHHDIKPENLFVSCGDESPGLKLLDFGICRSVSRSSRSTSHSSHSMVHASREPLMGTPSYMSPERIASLPGQDQRSDIWSMGVVLYELLVGSPPFGEGSDGDICARILAGHVNLERDAQVLPGAVRAVIERCLRPDPRDRFRDVRELASALRASLTMPDAQRGRQTGQFRSASAARGAASPREAERQRPRPRAGVTLTFLLVASLGVYVGAGLPGHGELGRWLSDSAWARASVLQETARWLSESR